jgi:uncharacterized protein
VSFDRRVLVALPSLVLLALLVPLWWRWPPPPLEARLGLVGLVAAGLATALALLAVAAGLERSNASFRTTSARLERLVRSLRLHPALALALALLTGVVEELFFRGWLMPHVGLVVQAALFMLLHPAGRSGWMYTLFTGFAGLVFGALVLATGSLVPALVAHVAVNAHGLTVRGRQGPLTPGQRR